MTPAAEIEPYRCVWRAVLAAAMRDIFAPSKWRGHGSGASADLIRHQAEQWIGSADFHRVCALAGLDGTKVEARVRRRIAEREAGTFNFADVDPWKVPSHRARQAVAA